MQSQTIHCSTVVARISTLILLLTFSACALNSPDAQAVRAEQHAKQAAAVLAKMADADSLAAAGLMTGRRDAESLSLLARAAAAAPDRADLVWLQVARCAKLPSCDPVPLEQRLSELDPTNGVSRWSALARAGAVHDSDGLNAALIAISHSERLDIYWTSLIAHLSRAVAGTKKMSLQESEVAVVGYLAALPLPPYRYVSASCKGENLQQPGITEICRGIAKALQNGDTYVTEMIGVAIAKRVWPEDSPEWKNAGEERRVYDHRSKLYAKLEGDIAHPDAYLALCAQYRREQDVFAAQLIAAGYDANPPAQ